MIVIFEINGGEEFKLEVERVPQRNEEVVFSFVKRKKPHVVRYKVMQVTFNLFLSDDATHNEPPVYKVWLDEIV